MGNHNNVPAKYLPPHVDDFAFAVNFRSEFNLAHHILESHSLKAIFHPEPPPKSGFVENINAA